MEQENVSFRVLRSPDHVARASGSGALLPEFVCIGGQSAGPGLVSQAGFRVLLQLHVHSCHLTSTQYQQRDSGAVTLRVSGSQPVVDPFGVTYRISCISDVYNS